jgi:hypothetical protein
MKRRAQKELQGYENKWQVNQKKSSRNPRPFKGRGMTIEVLKPG